MLTLRTAQLAALSTASAARFVDGATATLAAQWPSAFAELGEAEVRAWVWKAIARCERYGFDQRDQVIVYVTAMLRTKDPEFDRHPWARAVLEDFTLAGSMKAIALEDAVESALAPPPAADD